MDNKDYIWAMKTWAWNALKMKTYSGLITSELSSIDLFPLEINYTLARYWCLIRYLQEEDVLVDKELCN